MTAYFETSLVPDCGLMPLSLSNFSAFTKLSDRSLPLAAGSTMILAIRFLPTIKDPRLTHRVQNCLGRCHPEYGGVSIPPAFFSRGTSRPAGGELSWPLLAGFWGWPKARAICDHPEQPETCFALWKDTYADRLENVGCKAIPCVYQAKPKWRSRLRNKTAPVLASLPERDMQAI